MRRTSPGCLSSSARATREDYGPAGRGRAPGDPRPSPKEPGSGRNRRPRPGVSLLHTPHRHAVPGPAEKETTMKLVRRLVLLVLATVLLAATAYGVGHAGRPADDRSATASSPSGRAPAAEQPTAAAPLPAAAHSPAPVRTPARTPKP